MSDVLREVVTTNGKNVVLRTMRRQSIAQACSSIRTFSGCSILSTPSSRRTTRVLTFLEKFFLLGANRRQCTGPRPAAVERRTTRGRCRRKCCVALRNSVPTLTVTSPEAGLVPKQDRTASDRALETIG